jgi:NAD(P)-dependent dehydrogenase (short-subunit alcohol dehydrogenase family)
MKLFRKRGTCDRRQQGIGAAIAQAFINEGARVALLTAPASVEVALLRR